MVRPHRPTSRSGQAVLFILVALAVFIFFLLYIVDLHRIIQRKDQVQNAGDAAALAAARWQGSTMNLIGELNLMHALALTQEDESAVRAITNMQKRLCFTGPLTGLLAAQIAAKNNHIYVDQDMTDILKEHAKTIRNDYNGNYDGEMMFQEPWPGAWNEYADLISMIASGGIAAGPDNVQRYEFSSNHILLTKGFYEAVDGFDWCWFQFNAPGLLRSYSSYRDWAPLPSEEKSDYNNSEIFPLHISPVAAPLNQYFTAEQLEERAKDAGISQPTAQELLKTNVMRRVENWFFYNAGDWGEWTMIKPDGEDHFPITGPVRPEYDTAGADVILRVNATVDRNTADPADKHPDAIVWTAAAKPFGYLETDLGKEPVTAAAYFALPAFRNVRLVPIDAAFGNENSSADADWVRHIRSHLKRYLVGGKPPDPSCRFCRTLQFWEINPEVNMTETVVGDDGEPHKQKVAKTFREAGADWLDEFGHTCRCYTHSGGRGGGTRRGH